MGLHDIPKVEKPQVYIDRAFGAASSRASALKTKLSHREKDPLERLRRLEMTRLSTVSSLLCRDLRAVTKSFPSFDQLPAFYLELVKLLVDIGLVKKALAATQWAASNTERFYKVYEGRLRRCRDARSISRYRCEFYGRVSSLVKQIKGELENLEEARRIFRKLPTIKTSMPTVVIAGFPNVGKTSLLKALTGSEPEIAYYPFTTKHIMIGYLKQGESKIQFIDTPGLLDRPLSRRNRIELQAVAALKHLADVVVFVLDPSQNCGFSLDEQLRLLSEIEKGFRKRFVVVINKSDLMENDEINSLAGRLSSRWRLVLAVSTIKGDGVGLLKERVLSLCQKTEP